MKIINIILIDAFLFIALLCSCSSDEPKNNTIPPLDKNEYIQIPDDEDNSNYYNYELSIREATIDKKGGDILFKIKDPVTNVIENIFCIDIHWFIGNVLILCDYNDQNNPLYKYIDWNQSDFDKYFNTHYQIRDWINEPEKAIVDGDPENILQNPPVTFSQHNDMITLHIKPNDDGSYREFLVGFIGHTSTGVAVGDIIVRQAAE